MGEHLEKEGWDLKALCSGRERRATRLMLAVCAGEATVDGPQVEGGLRMRRARTQGEQQRNHREEARHEARQSKP